MDEIISAAEQKVSEKLKSIPKIGYAVKVTRDGEKYKVCLHFYNLLKDNARILSYLKTKYDHAEKLSLGSSISREENNKPDDLKNWIIFRDYYENEEYVEVKFELPVKDSNNSEKQKERIYFKITGEGVITLLLELEKSKGQYKHLLLSGDPVKVEIERFISKFPLSKITDWNTEELTIESKERKEIRGIKND